MPSQSLRRDLPDPPGAQLLSASTAKRAGQPLGGSSPSGHRSGQPFGSRSPTKGDSAPRLGRPVHPESQRGLDADSSRSFSLRSSSGSVKRSLLASLSASFRSPLSPTLCNLARLHRHFSSYCGVTCFLDGGTLFEGMTG